VSWPTVALGDIFQIARGGSPRPIDNYITSDADGVNWVSIRDASNSSKFITKTEKKIRPAGVAKSRMVYPGDFLLTNSMSFGRPYILQTTGCIHDGWLVLSSDKSVVDQDFFYHLLGSEFVYKKFAQLAAGAVVKNLNCDLVKTVQIPLPPLPEQRRIAAILDKADALRAKRREAIAKLDQLLQAVFLDMFGDPVTNPKGWPFKPLGELVSRKTINGAYYPADRYVTEGGVPMVHMSDAFYGVVRRTSLKRVDVSNSDKSKYEITSADILVSRRSLNYEGSAKPCLVEDIGEPLIFESSLIRVTPDKTKVSPLYLHHYLSNPRARSKYVFKHVTSATISGINQSGLNAIEVMLPGRDEQQSYEAVCNRHAQNRLRFEAQANMLDTTFFSIQSAAFSGTL